MHLAHFWTGVSSRFFATMQTTDHLQRTGNGWSKCERLALETIDPKQFIVHTSQNKCVWYAMKGDDFLGQILQGTNMRGAAQRGPSEI